MITTQIVFDHRKRAKDNENGPLEIRITVNRKPYYISTGLKVPALLWASGKVHKMDGWPGIEHRLSIIKRRVEDEVDACIADGKPIIPAEIRRKVWMDKDDSTAFIEWVENQIPLLNVKNGTRQHYVTLYSRLKSFGRMKAWVDVTQENIYLFDAWLHRLDAKQKDADVKAGIPVDKISDGCVWNYHKCLKRLLNLAVLNGLLSNNPYIRLRGQFSRGDRESISYLTRDELALVKSCHPLAGSTMQIVRDLFVFQAYTGLSYSDMQAFDIADYRMVDGVWVANGSRIKTGVSYISVLLPPAVQILERYGMKIPRIQNSKYNLLLKALGELLGIRTSLTSHRARHTFATLMLRSGAKIENVSAMLGHTNVRQTQRYAKVLAESVHADYQNFLKSL